MSEQLISVIVPIYNVEMYLNRCVASIVNQSYANLQIILVDDGSPDNCPAMCDTWAEKDPRILVIHKINGGLSDARNAGMERAQGDYICFRDSDDWVDARFIEILYRTATDQNCDLAECDYCITSGDAPAAEASAETTVWSTEQAMEQHLCDKLF